MQAANSKWAPLKTDVDSRERLHGESRSFAQDVWFRFRKKTAAMVSIILLIIVALISFVGPYFTPYSYSAQHTSLANIPPVFKTAELPGYEGSFYITAGFKLIYVGTDGTLERQIEQVAEDMVAKQYIFQYAEDELIYLDYSAKPPAVLDADGNRVEATKTVWNKSFVLGTDTLGRDILTRLMYGCRISLIVAVIAALVNMVIGIIYGSISGFLGGRVDAVMMRIVDIISTVPLTLYVILIRVVLDSSGLFPIIVALSSVYWVDMARVVRGQVLSLKNQEFVTASQTIGTSTREVILRHLVPNAMGPILVTVTMLIPSAIFMEAFLSYIGIGISPPMASLGTMCNDATETLRSAPYQLLIPALVICIIMFAFNFLGDGMRDALDPKLKK